MLDELCRRLYWGVWRRLPSFDDLLARLPAEERGMIEDMIKDFKNNMRALGG